MGANESKGMLSIESRNIFSILKKWLYTEQDIVFRELVSNAADAIEKRARLAEAGSGPAADGEITVVLDAKERRLIIRDNGVGMTAEEVQKYINNIAFSGAEEFISQNNQAGRDTIIGHFGVGFYSAFMLADHVAIETLSCQEGAEGVRWDCRADMSFEMEAFTKAEVGTDVILYLPEGSPYFEKPDTVYEIIRKYFVFARTPIYFEAEGHDHVMVNDPKPLWRKAKETVAKEEMDAFYKEFFDDVDDPLFWLQFESLDIGMRGILFFRATKQGTEELDGTIKVYNRGVYVGENMEALIPKFVNLQSGIIECDNLPLVVSRSTIRDENQKDDMVQLAYESLAQEVTIAFNELFTSRRAEYEAWWPDIGAFVKYGVLQDRTFASVMTRKVIFMDIQGEYQTVQEYMAGDSGVEEDTVYYASDRLDQSHYIELFKKCRLNALLFDHVIDQPLLYRMETMMPKVKFLRIDSNVASVFDKPLGPEDEAKAKVLDEKVTAALGERLGSMALKCVRIEHEGISAIIIKDEQARRLADMMEIYGVLDPMDVEKREQQSQSTLLFNLNNGMVRFLLEATDEVAVAVVANQLLDLSLLSQQALRPEDMEAFVGRSEAVLTAALERLGG